MAEWVTVGKADDIAEGDATAFDVNGEQIAVSRVEGELHAFSDICTHRQCNLSLGGEIEGTTIECECHGSVFDMTTGAVVEGPAEEPIATFGSPTRAASSGSRPDPAVADRSFVIVGASLAGATAAATLRAEGFDGSVVLVGAEPHLPYERPALSKEFLRGEQPIEEQYVRPEAWYICAVASPPPAVTTWS